MEDNKLNITFLPDLTRNDKPVKANDIKSGILDSIVMLDDDDFKVMAHTRLTRLNKAITAVLKDEDYRDTTQEAFQNIANLHNEKKVSIEGAELKYVATFTKYDFSDCNHPVLTFLDRVVERFKGIRKQLETEIKLIPQETQDIGHTEDGEVTTKLIGGSKKVYIDPDEVVEKINFVITDAQHLLDVVGGANGMFVINAPVIRKTMGIKVDKS